MPRETQAELSSVMAQLSDVYADYMIGKFKGSAQCSRRAAIG